MLDTPTKFFQVDPHSFHVRFQFQVQCSLPFLFPVSFQGSKQALEAGCLMKLLFDSATLLSLVDLQLAFDFSSFFSFQPVVLLVKYQMYHIIFSLVKCWVQMTHKHCCYLSVDLCLITSLFSTITSYNTVQHLFLYPQISHFGLLGWKSRAQTKSAALNSQVFEQFPYLFFCSLFILSLGFKTSK